MQDNPLGHYLDALLTPPEPQTADWDTLLAQAVEPFVEPRHLQHGVDQAAPSSPSTLIVGNAPVLARSTIQLSRDEQFIQVLLNLRLAAQLPVSRLRACLLQYCGEVLHPALLPQGSANVTRVVSHE